MIFYVGKMNCYEAYCEREKIDRLRWGRDIILATRATLAGKRYNPGDQTVICQHCIFEAAGKEDPSDKHTFERIIETIEMKQAGFFLTRKVPQTLLEGIARRRTNRR